MNAGLAGKARTRPMASFSVSMAWGFAALSKPMWLSLIWRNVKPFERPPAPRQAKQPDRFWHAARYRPKHAGSRPDHAFERMTAADAVVVMFVIRHLLSLSARPKLALQKVNSGSGPFIPEMDD